MKKIISAMLMVVIVFTLGAMPVSGASRTAPSDWARKSVEKANVLGIANGEYNYTAPISRKDFAELIFNYIKVAGLDVGEVVTSPFEDTKDEKIAALHALGIVNGKSEKHFAPDDTLTREEAATILSRSIEKLWGDVAVNPSLVIFADAENISDWAKNGVQLVHKLDIMNGTGIREERTVFSPKDSFTTEHAIATVVRLYNNTPDRATTFADKMNALMPEDTNYMFSPFSIKTALMMAANGAQGETMEEILKTLGVSDIEEYNKNTKTMLESLSKLDILKLETANSLWINSQKTGQRFSQEFKSKTRDIFGATSDIVNNKNALSKINGWVNEKTHGKIPTIISEKDANELHLMLINAVYFKARWADEFYITEKETFKQRDGEEVDTDFMIDTCYRGYSEKRGVTVVKLPYRQSNEEGTVKGVNVNMYLMMSDHEFNPEKALNDAEFERARIKLHMPKFEIEYSRELGEMLRQCGIIKAFEENEAQFEPMLTYDTMWVAKVLHKTYIKLDEEGTEAAAVTAIGGLGGAGGVTVKQPDPIEIKFNKPFTFVIRDDTSGEILFMGEYAFVNP